MSGRHAAGPVGSGAREATASPYIGRHRAPDLWAELDAAERAKDFIEAWGEPECVHPGDGCGHQCDCPCDWCEAVQARLRGDDDG